MYRPIRQRFSNDCGVAALATALGVSWLDAFGSLLMAARAMRVEYPRVRDGDGNAYYGVLPDLMVKACGAPRASGVPLVQANGFGGVLLVTWDSEWVEGAGRHWLAWWREGARVRVYNPSTGEVFDSSGLHSRGFRMTCHICAPNVSDESNRETF